MIFENNRVLIVRKRDAWILPGGKPEVGESDAECLRRELREELGVDIKTLRRFTTVEGTTPYRGDQIQVELYFVEIDGSPKPQAEITGIAWIAWEREFVYHDLSEPTTLALQALSKGGYL